MAIALVQRLDYGASSGGTSISTSGNSTISTTTGNLIVLCISKQNSASVTITDTAGNSWSEAGTVLTSGGNSLQIFYCANITGNAAHTFTASWTGSTGFRMIGANEFSGCATSSVLDGTSTGTGNSTNLATGSVTVSAASAVIVAVMESDSLTSLVAGSGYSLVRMPSNDGAAQYFAHEYHIVSASETATATSGSNPWAIKAAAFKVAASSFIAARKLPILQAVNRAATY